MSSIALRSVIVGVVAFGVVSAGAVRAADEKTVGRVRVTTVDSDAESAWNAVSASLESRFGSGPDKEFPDRRVISLRPVPGDPTRFEATIYDYASEKAYDAVIDAAGNELSRSPLLDQPARTVQELEDAYAVVRRSAEYGRAVAKGELELYEAMPPVTVDAFGRRLVNVGIMSRPTAGKPLGHNEIVSVSLASGEIVHYPTGAPDTSRAGLFACGPGSSGCSTPSTTCGSYQISWPAVDPVWKFVVRHPSCTSNIQGDGTGLEITNVYYRDRLIIKRGEVPVLNVQYVNNACGPYRDWLTSEDCFTATGTDVPQANSGFRVTTSAPSTLCEAGTDAGNFKGVAIFDQGDALWLMTETNAGWYRYVMEWRFHLDGTIEPIFGFGATSNNCTCNAHFHHVYWRIEWAVDATADGTNDDPATGICSLERHRAGTPDEYDPVTTEGTFVRPTTDVSSDTWRIRNPLTGNGYVLKPGGKDGSNAGDAYGKWDLTAVAQNANEINDPNSNTSINVDPWVSGETLGGSKRLVTWYHATWTHDDPGGTGEACELVGPQLIPLVPCAGSMTLDRSAYTCGSSVAVTLNDSDLKNQGTAAVSAFSSTEPGGEPVTLTETPAGSGHFVGAVVTTAAAAAPGDGMVSVVDGDAIHVRYVDASACGTPNVSVEKSAPLDCVTPTIQSVHVAVAGTSATIDWDTSEDATGIVHYGPAIPTASSAAQPGSTHAHTVTLSGLAPCTTYYFWLESADPAGNIAASNHGGGYYAFTTGQNAQNTYVSADTPVSIPDNNATGATSTISVADTPAVQDVDVNVNLTHTYDGDLVLSLITPTGTSIPLSSRRGGSGDNFTNTTFDDEAATSISTASAPFTGSYRPDSPLTAADGISAAGAWRFKVVDQAAADVGTINSWRLLLTLPATTCASSGPPPPVAEGGASAALTASRADAPGSIVHLAWDAATCTAKNYHLVFGSLATLPTYTVAGGVCDLGPLGSYDWENVPAGDLWFVAVGDDANRTEGSWGTSAPSVDRNGTTPSGVCGYTARTNAGTCP